MEGAAWPYLVEEPLNHQLGGPYHYTPQQAYQNLSPLNYGLEPQHQGPWLSQQDVSPPHYGPAPQNQATWSPQQGFLLPPYSYGYEHNQYNVFHNGGAMSDLPYQRKENQWEEEQQEQQEEEDEGEEEEEEDFLPFNNTEEALQELNIYLPRLAVTAPSSVLPQKGGGRCRLPNLGNSSYMNAVLQCLYHTPSFPASLTLACEELEEALKQNTVARALSFVMAMMDDVKLMKRGMLAFFKGVCGLRDETFAGMEHQEPHDLLAGLLLWLHKDLAKVDSVGCACTKTPLSKHLAKSHSAKHHASPQGSNHPPNYTIYTGHNHNHSIYHQQSSSPPPKSNGTNSKREGNVCQKCSVTYQRRSFISDMFEGIHQIDIICAKVGIILHTTYQRFTSLSVPLNVSGEITLEEAMQQYYGMNMVMWDCEYCNKTHLCHQQIRVLCSPRILVIHFSRPTKRHSARMQSVSFPTDHLTLEDHMILGKKDRYRCHKYSLYAVCNHRGTTPQGHYNAVCRANKSQRQQGNWFLFDDDEVSKTSYFRNRKEADILFYISLDY